MIVFLYILACAAAAVFLVACGVRAARYARAPIHLRWELYPVPHEAPARVAHGGSYFEAGEWWKGRRHFSLAGEIRFMVPEMLFLKGLRESNRPLWYRSFPFHFGLYMLAGGTVLLFLAAVDGMLYPGPENALNAHILRLAALSASLGLLLAVCGATALLYRRLTDPSLRDYTAPGDIFNLVFFVVALGLAGAGYLARPAGSPGALAVATGLLSWDTSLQLPLPFAAGLAAMAVLVAYVPLTHMSHFIAKYFTYHAVRWDDAPLRDNRAMAAKLAGCLAYRPTWSASHLGADGTRTWGEVAASNPSEAKR